MIIANCTLALDVQVARVNGAVRGPLRYIQIPHMQYMKYRTGIREVVVHYVLSLSNCRSGYIPLGGRLG